MNAEQLKNSILQYAMQGKIVPQNPNDEPAEKLVNRIKEEKDRLFKEKVIKKEKPLPSITENDIPFEIPQNWRWVRLQEIVQIINGDRGKNYPSKDKLTNEGIPFISALNIENGAISKEKLLYMTEDQFEKLGNGKLVRGDLVLCIRGSLGKNGRFLFERGAIASSLVILRDYLNQSTFYEYLSLYLNSIIFSQEISKYNNGSVQPNLAARDLAKFIVPLPPFEEQKRIIKKVDDLFKEVNNYSLSYTELTKLQNSFPERLEKSILHYAIQGKLVPQDPNDEPADKLLERIEEEKNHLIKEKIIKKEKPLPPIAEEEIPFEIPGSWRWVRLIDITESIHYGYTASAQLNGNAKLLRITDIQDNNVLWENVPYCDISADQLEKYALEERDILIARTGGTVGKSFLITHSKETAVFASYLIRIKLMRDINENYLMYYLRSPFYWSQLNDMSAGTGQPNVNAQKLKSLVVPLPPLEEQERIVQKLEEAFEIPKNLELFI